MKRRKKYTHVLVVHVKELFQLNTTVGEGTEGTLLLEVGRHLGVGDHVCVGL